MMVYPQVSSSEKPKVGISTFVLGVQDRFRGNELVSKLRDCGLAPNVVWGPSVSSDNLFLRSSTNQEYAKFTLRRDIKQEEVACVIGHMRMYEKFLESGSDWGFFLEDDALLIGNPRGLLSKLRVCDVPSHITCQRYVGTDLSIPDLANRDILKSLGVQRKLDPSFGAFGYLLNRPAAELIVDKVCASLINTPDWPYIWPKAIRYYTLLSPVVSHPIDPPSSIIGPRVNRVEAWRERLPSIRRFIKGKRLGIPQPTLMWREITLKVIRIFLQLVQRINRYI